MSSESDHYVDKQMSGIRQWTDVLSEIHGPVRVEAGSKAGLDGSLSRLDLWQLRLCRLELAPHRVSLTPALARPGTHLLNLVRFQTQGTVFFEQDGQTVRIGPGDCFVHNLSRPYVVHSSERTAHDAVILPIELVKRQTVPVELLWSRKIAAADRDDTARLAHNILRTILAEPPRLSESTAASVAQALLSLLHSFFSRDIMGDEGFTRAAMTRWRAKAYIEDHLRDSDLDVPRVAAALGCSPRYLHQIFRDDVTSVGRHIWRARIERCHNELQSPANASRSITDIAFSWGFSSAAHFSRLFRDTYGFPPSQLLRRGRGS